MRRPSPSASLGIPRSMAGKLARAVGLHDVLAAVLVPRDSAREPVAIVLERRDVIRFARFAADLTDDVTVSIFVLHDVTVGTLELERSERAVARVVLEFSELR